MDDVVVRSRYPRRNVPSRKRRKSTGDTNKILERILRQIILCVLILVVAGVVKSVNTPTTNFLTEKIKNILFQDIELNSIYAQANDLFNKLMDKVSSYNNATAQSSDTQTKQAESGLNQQAAPASVGISTPQGTTDGSADSSGSVGDSAGQQPSQDDQGQLGSGSSSSPDPSPSPTPKLKPKPSPSPVKSKYTFITPAIGALGSGFSERINPITKAPEFHNGVDIEAKEGDPIKAALGGEVSEATYDPNDGNYVEIKHADGFITVYAHCSKLLVKKGQKVKQGAIIAKVGDTGASTGTHLHFGIWKDGTALNPLDYIKIQTK